MIIKMEKINMSMRMRKRREIKSDQVKSHYISTKCIYTVAIT
jgi:hypothetical protein